MTIWHHRQTCGSDVCGSDVQQTRLAQKDLQVVVFITMALIAISDFRRLGEIINSCINNLEINAHTLKRDVFIHFIRESVFEACL